MAPLSEEQKQALRDEALLLQRALPSAQSAQRLREIEFLLADTPDEDEETVTDTRRLE